MAEDREYAYNSFIKNIYLKIPGGYKFRHQSFGDKEDVFLGRKDILDSFVDILTNGTTRGAYLVTGYRGMGKTSFVNYALNEAGKKGRQKQSLRDRARSFFYWLISKNARKDKPLREFRLSLAQSELKDIDILKHIVSKLLEHVESTNSYRYSKWISLSNLFSLLWPVVTVGLILLNFGLLILAAKTSLELKTVIENLLGVVSLSALITLFFYRVIDWFYGKYVSNKPIGRIFIITALLGLVIFSTDLFYGAWFLFVGLTYVKLIALLLGYLGLVTIVLGFFVFIVTSLCMKAGQTIKSIHKRLNRLHNRCNAQITSEDQFRETFSSSVSSLFRKDVMIYPIANPREIEAELITILDHLRSHFQCIFVFDELDKVDPNFDQYHTVAAETNSEKRTLLNDLRERRHLITHILGSLKYFINEAEAKFIFIAGREMFEAALADISDRQSSISSIFHRVIYVDSFLKDQSEGETMASSIGVLVERRLAHLLLPAKQDLTVSDSGRFWRKKSTEVNQPLPDTDFFSAYYKYLTGKPPYANRTASSLSVLNSDEAQKIIFVLQNFLGYLVYRSNGSPKKVTRLLEEFITSEPVVHDQSTVSRNILFSSTNHTIPVNPDHGHHLYFSHYEQYKLGFTAYLFQPFLTMYSSFMKRYSDSTLVSTPYLIDNLIKFHPFAFSAQNLELIPEILSTNKSPVSRPFLEELITFLGQNHIRRTESGLFEYKFYDRTHNEITFISKIFEDDAAAFNFTLDENFSVKAQLISKIRQLREAHRHVGEKAPGAENPAGSIIFLNRLLGDVRFQDEEYEDAIVSYQDAIQMLDYDRLKYANHLITFVRLKLKLGLAYEKIKAHEFALGHYAGVIEEGGAVMFQYANKHDVVYRELLLLVMQAYSATLYLQEKLQEGITFQKIKHVVMGFDDLLRGFQHEYDNRDILVATFYSNIGTALYYKNMVLPQRVNEKRVEALPKPDGSVSLTKQMVARTALLACFPASIDRDFVVRSAEELSSINNPNRIHSDARISFVTYVYYKLTLQKLLGYETDNSTGNDTLTDILRECPKLIHIKDGQLSYRSLQHIRRLTGIGHALAKLGDYLLPIAQRNSVIVTDALGCFYDGTGKGPAEREVREQILKTYFITGAASDLNDTVHPRLIIHVYYLASLFFLNASETANAAFQLRKILFVLRSLKLIAPPNSGLKVSDVLSCLEDNLVKRILELSSWMSHSSDRPQLSKTKKYLGINTARTPHTISSQLYGNLSNSPDTKETILAYALLRTQHQKYKSGANTLMDCFKQPAEHKLLSPYGSIAHHIVRVMELELHTNMNYELLHSYCNGKLRELHSSFSLDEWQTTHYYACNLYDIDEKRFLDKTAPKTSKEESFLLILGHFDGLCQLTTDKELLQKWVRDYAGLIVNSVFNLTQIDRIINTYRINYILSYSYMAQVHQNLGTWLKHLQLCRILNKRCDLGVEIDTLLEELIGPQLTSSLDTLTSYQVAIQYYYQGIQLHKEGGTYRHQISNLVYLEDDYNDNLYHFGAALERFRINSGSIRKKITFLAEEIDKASMYKYSTYVGDENK